jgi:ParB family chromosome partitioning protein
MKELSLLKEPGKMSLSNAGKVALSRLVKVGDIKTRKEFEGLFPHVPANFEKIKRRMEEKGYDNSQPVHLWETEGKAVLIDGHHRVLASKEVGIAEIPGYFHSFEDIEEAVEYAIALQVERRNLSDAELLIMLKVVDQLKARGKGAGGEKGKSAKRTAEILGTNASKIEKARIVEKYGGEEIKGKVASGELSLNQAYLEARTAKERQGERRDGGDGSGEDCPERSGGETNFDYRRGSGREPEHAETGDSPNVRFLKSAVILLGEKKEHAAIGLLIDHFLRKEKRELFLKILPADLQKAIREYKQGGNNADTL